MLVFWIEWGMIIKTLGTTGIWEERKDENEEEEVGGKGKETWNERLGEGKGRMEWRKHTEERGKGEGKRKLKVGKEDARWE